MSLARAEFVPVRRFAVVCFGLSAQRANRQPWLSADGLASGLAGLGHAVLVITDHGEPPRERGYATVTVPRLFERGRFATAVRDELASWGTERVYVLLGAARLARLRDLIAPCPVSLVLASPRLRREELARLPSAALLHEWRILALPVLDSLLPATTLRLGFQRSRADEVVYLSEAARSRYAVAGLPLGRHVRPQVRPIAPSVARLPRACATIVYLGPPLVARGADLAVAAFERAVTMGLRARLLLLLRSDAPPAALRRLLERCAASPQAAAITCERRDLAPEELQRRLSGADVFLLPFRIPISEVPVVAIEAGLTGRPVVALDTPGVSEVVHAFGGIVVDDPADLPAALVEACGRSPRRAPSPVGWTSWQDAVRPLLAAPRRTLRDLALLALCGGDGAGKTLLADTIARHAGSGATRVWSRFRNYLSLPLLALTRLTGHNRKEQIDGVKVGYRDFAQWRPLALTHLALQLADCRIDLLLRFRPRPGRLLVADRCALDTLVDLAIETGLYDLVIDHIAPRLAARLPAPWAAVVVERPVAAIAVERPDALVDRHFARRRMLYRRLAQRLRLPIIHNASTVDAAVAAIHEAVAAQAAPAGARR